MNTIDIHGKPYVTVAGRVEEAHKANKTMSITTEIINQNPVVIKATVVVEKGTFTAFSAANPAKAIEKMSPYEVAETSAIGRALGFAGYGIVEGIATADEVVKAQAPTPPQDDIDRALNETYEESNDPIVVKTAGPTSKNPGRKYQYNTITKQFVSWVDEVNS